MAAMTGKRRWLRKSPSAAVTMNSRSCARPAGVTSADWTVVPAQPLTG
ncbi:hypothetical protein A4R44_01417 [Amycolatopsis sp. M39]|nr:hypothetical protein A4R44_01417 [Amycolatopsis sp. M39]